MAKTIRASTESTPATIILPRRPRKTTKQGGGGDQVIEEVRFSNKRYEYRVGSKWLGRGDLKQPDVSDGGSDAHGIRR